MVSRRLLPVVLAFFLASTACGGDEQARRPGEAFAKSDLKRLVLQKGDLKDGHRLVASAELPKNAVAAEYPGIDASLVAAYEADVAIGVGPNLISRAMLFDGDTAAALATVKKAYETSGPTRIVAKPADPPGFGDDSFAFELSVADPPVAGWVLGWRVRNVVLVVQGSRQGGIPHGEIMSLAKAVAERAK